MPTTAIRLALRRALTSFGLVLAAGCAQGGADDVTPGTDTTWLPMASAGATPAGSAAPPSVPGGMMGGPQAPTTSGGPMGGPASGGVAGNGSMPGGALPGGALPGGGTTGGGAAGAPGAGADSGGVAGFGPMPGAGAPAPVNTEPAPVIDGGACCPDGNCICRGDPPSALTSRAGPFDYDSFELANGTVYYPTDAEPPFAAIAIVPGFLNSGPEMAAWGPFYASHGFVLITAYTTPIDIPLVRASILIAAVDALKAENGNSSSPLHQKLVGWYGTSGYSMGGGGTSIASGMDPSLKSSVPLAAWGPDGSGVQVPTLFFCGSSDGVAPCAFSDGGYATMPESTPKAVVVVRGATHFNWFGPESVSGSMALAFQKVYLEGDERWKPLLVAGLADNDATTNIQ